MGCSASRIRVGRNSCFETDRHLHSPFLSVQRTYPSLGVCQRTLFSLIIILRDLFYHVQPVVIVLISAKTSTIARVACFSVVLRPSVRSQFHNMTCTLATKMQPLCGNCLQRRDDAHCTM
jgi:hypothetical protein